MILAGNQQAIGCHTIHYLFILTSPPPPDTLSITSASQTASPLGTTGAVSPQVRSLRLSTDTLNGLLRLAEAEKFFAMPPTLGGGEPVTDGGSTMITIHTTTQSKTVIELRPTRNPHFDQLVAVLRAVASLTS